VADNFVTNAGSGGSTFASDDVSSVQYPRMKNVVGPDGVAQEGWTPYHLVSAATTNATSVKASAAKLGFVMVSNVNAAARYLKFYNKASAPTVGSDTPVLTIVIPGAATGGGAVLNISDGMAFSTGLAFALTTEATDAGSTGVAVSEIVVNLGYA